MCQCNTKKIYSNDIKTYSNDFLHLSYMILGGVPMNMEYYKISHCSIKKLSTLYKRKNYIYTCVLEKKFLEKQKLKT